MGAKLIVRDRGWSKLMAAAKDLRGAPPLRVGMLAETAERSGSELTNAELAIILHFGTRDIPGRPFLSMAVHANGREWNKRLVEIATAVLAGKMTAADGLAALGPKVVADIKRTMRNVGIPDAPETLEQKSGATPLVDTRQLINSVTFEVAGG